MQRLPTELRQMIVDEVASVKVCFQGEPRKYVGTFEHIADLKSLRLSCCAFADLVTRHIFSEVWLFITDDSFHKLKEIARHPTIPGNVRNLKIFWKLFDKKSFKTYDDYLNHLYDGCSAYEADYMPPPDRRREGWDALTSIIEQHDRLSDETELLLTDALAAFSGLVSIEPGIAEEILRNKEAMQIESGTIQSLAQSTLLADLEKGWQRDLHGGAVVHKLFKAMFESQCQGQEMVLFNCGANMDSTFLDFPPDMEDTARSVANGLVELRLRLEIVDNDRLEEVVEKGFVTRFLGWLLNVQSLSLQTSYSHEAQDMSLLLGSACLPQLRQLHMYRLRLTAEYLVGFLERHKSTLVYLSIAETELIAGTWRQVFESMKGERALKCCSFENNYVTLFEQEELFVHVRGDDVEEDLNAFAFDGKPWPSETCAHLELEAHTA